MNIVCLDLEGVLQDSPGRQLCGGDHNVECLLFDFFLHCHHLPCSRVILAVML